MGKNSRRNRKKGAPKGTRRAQIYEEQQARKSNFRPNPLLDKATEKVKDIQARRKRGETISAEDEEFENKFAMQSIEISIEQKEKDLGIKPTQRPSIIRRLFGPKKKPKKSE